MSSTVGVFHVWGVEFALEKFDSVAMGTFLLALATFALAAVTYRLLRADNEDREIAMDALAAAEDQARIGQRQAEIAEKTLAAQIQPALVEPLLDLQAKRETISFPGVAAPVDLASGGIYAAADLPGAEGLEVRCAVPFLNAGRGIAALSNGWIEIYGPRGFSAIDLTRANLPVGGMTHVLFLFRHGEPGFSEVGEMVRQRSSVLVALEYSDISGRQTRTTRFLISSKADGPMDWTITQVDISDPDSGSIPPPGAVRAPTV